MSTLVTRARDNGERALRDPFSLARELFSWDPFNYGAVRNAQTFTPAFEVKETADKFFVRADLPGVQEKDIDLSVHKGILTVGGRRTAEERKEGESYYLFERQYGEFSRSFALPESADADNIGARFDNGVLTVEIAKKAKVQPKKIELKK